MNSSMTIFSPSRSLETLAASTEASELIDVLNEFRRFSGLSSMIEVANASAIPSVLSAPIAVLCGPAEITWRTSSTVGLSSGGHSPSNR